MDEVIHIYTLRSESWRSKFHQKYRGRHLRKVCCFQAKSHNEWTANNEHAYLHQSHFPPPTNMTKEKVCTVTQGHDHLNSMPVSFQHLWRVRCLPLCRQGVYLQTQTNAASRLSSYVPRERNRTMHRLNPPSNKACWLSQDVQQHRNVDSLCFDACSVRCVRPWTNAVCKSYAICHRLGSIRGGSSSGRRWHKPCVCVQTQNTTSKWSTIAMRFNTNAFCFWNKRVLGTPRHL